MAVDKQFEQHAEEVISHMQSQLYDNPMFPKPLCDFCPVNKRKVAAYDARLSMGIGSVWGYACEECFKKRNGKLGTGWGQRL